jgi:hypothetical protein
LRKTVERRMAVASAGPNRMINKNDPKAGKFSPLVMVGGDKSGFVLIAERSTSNPAVRSLSHKLNR